MCTPNNTDKRKLVFLDKECETKHKRIKELESLLDEIYAPIKQVYSTTKFWIVHVKGIIFIKLETLKSCKEIFFCEQ